MGAAALAVVAAAAGCTSQGVTQVGATATPTTQATAPATPAPATPTTAPLAGLGWHAVDAPRLPPTSGLGGVVALDATHAFAVGSVGYTAQQPNTGTPLVLRWDGQHWVRMPLPGITWHGGLQKVAADSPTDVWAVGSTNVLDANRRATHVLRYDGSRWREVPFPAGRAGSGLFGITDLAVVAGHAWLVGLDDTNLPVIHEWDGHAWRRPAAPAECARHDTSFGGMPGSCDATAVVAFAPDDVWAAGHGAWAGFDGPLLYHWDGTAWRAVKVGMNRQPLAFTSIGGSRTDIWAVGGPQGGMVAVHGDGRTWQQAAGLPIADLPGVATDPAGRLWLLENFTNFTSALATYTPRHTWANAPAPRPPGSDGLTLDGLSLVPGSALILAVGETKQLGKPRASRALILAYTYPAG